MKPQWKSFARHIGQLLAERWLARPTLPEIKAIADIDKALQQKELDSHKDSRVSGNVGSDKPT